MFKSQKKEASWIIANGKRKPRKLGFDSKRSNEIISWTSKTTTKKDREVKQERKVFYQLQIIISSYKPGPKIAAQPLA